MNVPVIFYGRASTMSERNLSVCLGVLHQLYGRAIVVCPINTPFSDKIRNTPTDIIESDCLDSALLANAITNALHGNSLARIYCLLEAFVVPAAKMRGHFSVPGLSLDSATLFRDKNAMHIKARQLGIRTPEWHLPEALEGLRDFAKDVSYPIIIKPRDGMASRNTHRVDNDVELKKVWEIIQDNCSRFRAEKFIHGTQYYVDSLVGSSQVLFCGLSQYTYSVYNYANEIAGGITIKQPSTPQHQTILDYNRKIIEGFSLACGVTHIEFFVSTEGDVYFGEAAARPGGGPIVEIVEEAYGVNLLRGWIACDHGEQFSMPQYDKSVEIGAGYFSTGRGGKIRAIANSAEIKKHPTVLRAEIWNKIGDYVEPPQACNNMLGYFINRGTSFDHVLKDFSSIQDLFYVEYE